MATPCAQDFTFEPITPAVGAIAGPIDLRQPLAPETARAMRQTLLDHGVVFFRDQDLTAEQMAAFMSNFGTLGTEQRGMTAVPVRFG